MLFAPIVLTCLGTGVLAICLARLTTLLGRPFTRSRRVVEGVPILLLAFGALAIAAFSVTDSIAFRHEEFHGQTYIVDGHRMRINCTGAGSPTLILDSGLGNDGLIWSTVQPVLANSTRTCSFDRAGYGWSDPVATRRDAHNLSIELHDLLETAGVRGLIILVGHSIAGLYIRDYALHFPEEVAGLIFVDASVPSDMDPTPIVREESKPSLRDAIGASMFAMEFNRLFGACPGSLPGARFLLVAPRLEGICREHLATFQGELNNFAISAQEAAAFRSTHLPILILSRDTSDPIWNRKQDGLRMLAPDSRRIVVAGSGHYIQVDEPSSFEEQVRAFMQQIRDNPHESVQPAFSKPR